MTKVSGYTDSSNEPINISAARKDLFYRVRNSGTYATPNYDTDPLVSGRNATSEEMKEVLNTVLYKRIELNTAQIKTLNSVPIELIAAPGAGYAIDVINAACAYTYNTAAFNAASGILEIYHDTGGSQHLRTESGIIKQTTDKFQKFYHQTGDLGDIVANKSVKIRCTDDSATGGGSCVIHVQYQILIV